MLRERGLLEESQAPSVESGRSHRTWGALKISYVGNKEASGRRFALRPARHWDSPAGWRGSPQCTLVPDCPQLAWERTSAAILSWRGHLEDWGWGPGLLFAASGFESSWGVQLLWLSMALGPRPRSPLGRPRYTLLPNCKYPEIQCIENRVLKFFSLHLQPPDLIPQLSQRGPLVSAPHSASKRCTRLSPSVFP